MAKLGSLVFLLMVLVACKDGPTPADKKALKILTELRLASPECDPMWTTTLKAIDDKRDGQDGFTTHADALAAIEFLEKTPPPRNDLSERFASHVVAHAKELESRELLSSLFYAPCDSLRQFSASLALVLTPTQLLETSDQKRIREQIFRYVERGGILWVLDVGLKTSLLARAIEAKVIQSSSQTLDQVGALQDAIKQKAGEAGDAMKQLNLPQDTKSSSLAQRKAALALFADQTSFATTQLQALRELARDLRKEN